MSQFAQNPDPRERVHIGAFVDRQTRQQLSERARQEDRSMSAVIRKALEAELQREREAAS